MSTRSIIALTTKQNTIDFISCHFDGDIDYVGRILVQNYNTYKKVKNLIDLGDICSLEKSLSKTKFLDNNLYQTKCRSFNNEEQFMNYFRDIQKHDKEFIYLFKNNKWYVYIPYLKKRN